MSITIFGRQAAARPQVARSQLSLIAFLFMLGLFGGCSTPVEVSGCTADRDCNNFEQCDIDTGFCLCADDQACDATEFCNTQGRCQPQLGCASNADCGGAERPQDICDTTTSQCLTLDASTQCVLDSQCPFGSYCDQKFCRQGCRENGDCGVDTPCINGQCDTRPGACNASSYCAFGQSCNLSSFTCVDHPDRASLCQWCDPQSFFTEACPNGNSCLIDTSLPPDVSCQIDADCGQWPGARCATSPTGEQCSTNADCSGGATCEGAFFGLGQCATRNCSRNFCGSDGCSESNPCPQGYTCNTLIIVSNAGCTSNAQCASNSCLGGGENVSQGFCSCLSDADCPQSPLQGITSSCEDPGPNGRCVIGTTCGPSSGLLCEDLR